MADLVSLFRCKKCGVRMYDRDCAGHLARHGLTVPADQVFKHFERGPATERARAGDGAKPMYYQRHKKAGVKVETEEEDLN